MIELGDEQALVVLGLSALGYIDVNSRHTLGPTGTVVGNEAARFKPPDFSPRAHKAKLADDLTAPFLERTNVLGAQSLRIVSMHARAPFLGGDLRAALGHAVSCRGGAVKPQSLCGNIVGKTTHARSPMNKIEL